MIGDHWDQLKYLPTDIGPRCSRIRVSNPAPGGTCERMGGIETRINKQIGSKDLLRWLLELLTLGGKITGYAISRGLHAFLAFLPTGRAHFAMLFGVLQGIHHAQHFIHIATQG